MENLKRATIKDVLFPLELKELYKKIEDRENHEIMELEVYYLDYIGEVFLKLKHEIPNGISLSVYALQVIFERVNKLNLSVF